MKSKIWVKDKNFQYKSGDIVKCVRKKKNGHPKYLNLGGCYVVRRVENDDLFVQEMNTEYDLSKVNKNYFVPIIKMRDELINDILSDD